MYLVDMHACRCMIDFAKCISLFGRGLKHKLYFTAVIQKINKYFIIFSLILKQKKKKTQNTNWSGS